MVDELDRCLPLYAIKVLERIHHVFNEIENVVVIVAMEKKQISNSLHQIYGDEMDVDRYLKKIIAFSFKLDNGSAHNFIDKYASYMEMFDIKERDGLEEFLKEITAISPSGTFLSLFPLPKILIFLVLKFISFNFILTNSLTLIPVEYKSSNITLSL